VAVFAWALVSADATVRAVIELATGALIRNSLIVARASRPLPAPPRNGTCSVATHGLRLVVVWPSVPGGLIFPLMSSD